jgi:uncharacterized protein
MPSASSPSSPPHPSPPVPEFVRRTEIPVPPSEAFAWHERPGAFQRLTPPWQPVELAHSDGIRDGDRAVIRLGPGPFPIRWTAEHRDYVPGRQFRDVQVSGPFGRWEHTHTIRPHDADRRRSILEDRVDYALPLESLTEPLAGAFARRELVRIFGYRHRMTREDLIRHDEAGLRPLSVGITGSTGIIGRALTAFLTTGGHSVLRLVRTREEALLLDRSDQERAAYWDPTGGGFDLSPLEDLDAVVHLAGEPVFPERWTRRKRARIFDSRVRGTRILADALAALRHPPATLLSASGVGYYGDAGNTALTEGAPPGEGFLAEVCQAWEAATAPAEAAGIRVCHLRIGAALTPEGGLLGFAHLPFLLGLGGVIGRGERWVPWIALDDVVYAVLHLLGQREVGGPVNVVAPRPVSQRAFADALGEVLGRPTPLRVPPAALRVMLGEMAESLPLQSERVVPHRLANSGFSFAYPRLDAALLHLLGRSPAVPIHTPP